MRVAKKIDEVRSFVRAARMRGAQVGFVPTMGALHQGHLALIRACVAQNDVSVVSIFVNPTQFGPREDFNSYPRPFEQDVALCEKEGVDLVFAPSAGEMYSPDHATYVEVEGLTAGLCGQFRPGHFRGVTTVVSKLFNIVEPDTAYFGEKDYQQLIVIKRMVADLNFPVRIVPIPTVREADGLAVSSRNLYLSARERRAAPALYRALCEGAKAAAQGASGFEVEKITRQALEKEPLFKLQYVQAVHPETLQPREDQGVPMVIAAAAYLGSTRLIDNIKVEGRS